MPWGSNVSSLSKQSPQVRRNSETRLPVVSGLQKSPKVMFCDLLLHLKVGFLIRLLRWELQHNNAQQVAKWWQT